MTIFLTVLSGVAVFVLGQVVLKYFIEPASIQEQNKVIGETIEYLILYFDLDVSSELHASRLTTDNIARSKDIQPEYQMKAIEDGEKSRKKTIATIRDAAKQLQAQASRLLVTMKPVWPYWFWSWSLIKRVPYREDVHEAARLLYEVSLKLQTPHENTIAERRKMSQHIARLLQVEDAARFFEARETSTMQEEESAASAATP